MGFELESARFKVNALPLYLAIGLRKLNFFHTFISEEQTLDLFFSQKSPLSPPYYHQVFTVLMNIIVAIVATKK